MKESKVGFTANDKRVLCDERRLALYESYRELDKTVEELPSVGQRVGELLCYLVEHGGRLSISLDANEHEGIYHYSLKSPTSDETYQRLSFLKKTIDEANEVKE